MGGWYAPVPIAASPTHLPSRAGTLEHLLEEICVERIAFVGLGTMGAAMAANLRRAGFELTVWNRTPGRSS